MPANAKTPDSGKNPPRASRAQLEEALHELKKAQTALSRYQRIDFRQLSDELASKMSVDRVHSVFDQAAQGDTREMFALYRDVLVADGHIATELLKRKLAVIANGWAIQPWDSRVAADVEAAQFIEDQIGQTRGWFRSLGDALHSTLWPVVVLEKVFAATGDARRPYRLVELHKLEDELIDMRDGGLRLFRVTPEGIIDRGRSDAPRPGRHIIHRNHLLSTPDRMGGTMRSLVFWWLFTAMDRDWWIRFLDRFGIPFPVGKYERGNEESKQVLKEAFRWAVKLGGIVCDSETDVELMSVNTAQGGEGFAQFFQIAQREKSKIILGQTLSSDAQSTGLGSGVADLQSDVRQDLCVADGLLLGEMLRMDVFAHLLELNGLPGRPPQILFGSASGAEKKLLAETLRQLKEAGLEVNDAGLDKAVELFGLGLQRVAAPAPLGSAGGFPQASEPQALALAARTGQASLAHQADVANAVAARGTAAGLSRAFRGDLAPVRRLIELSRSPAELEESLRSFFADWPAERTARILEEALTAYTLNAPAAR